MKTKSIIVIIASIFLILTFTPATTLHGQCVSCYCNAQCAIYWYYCCYEGYSGFCGSMQQCGALYCGVSDLGCSDCFTQCR